MNGMVTAFFDRKSENASNLAATLIQNQEEVISAFGGITNIIELCLTNPNISQHVNPNSQQFQAFVHLIQVDCNNNLSKSNDREETVNNKNRSVSTRHNKIENNHRTQQLISLHTKQDYNDCKLIIESSVKNSLCYKLIDNKSVAEFIYSIILSKTLNCVVFVIFCVSWTLDWLSSNHMPRIRIHFIIWFFMIYVITILYFISLVFAANTMIIRLTMNTFDFWFKIYNVIVAFTALWIRAYFNYYHQTILWNNNTEFALECTGHLCSFMACVALFCIDAFGVSVIVKRIIISLASFGCGGSIIYQYFFTLDYEYNPFDTKYTNISFKSVLLSSFVNVWLFISKPLCRDFRHFIKRIFRNTKRNISIHLNARNMNGESSINRHIQPKSAIANQNIAIVANDSDIINYQRCSAVYMRPYVRWHKINNINMDTHITRTNDEQKINEILIVSQ